MGILKVYHMDKDLVKHSDLVDVLYDMIRDADGGVVANCIVVLDEIMLEEGGIAINAPIVHHLLSRLNDFNEWGLCWVLKLAARYKPASDEETFQLMNVLDPVLRTSNAGVVLEAIGCFVQLTKALPELHAQVYERIKTPLLTLMASGAQGEGNQEQMYCLLKHTELLVFRCREAFASEHRRRADVLVLLGTSRGRRPLADAAKKLADTVLDRVAAAGTASSTSATTSRRASSTSRCRCWRSSRPRSPRRTSCRSSASTRSGVRDLFAATPRPRRGSSAAGVAAPPRLRRGGERGDAAAATRPARVPRRYANDVDIGLAKSAIQAVGSVAARLRSKAEACCGLLVEFLDHEYSPVKAEALLVAKDVLRKYPDRRGDVLPSIGRYLGELDASEPKGRAAALFLVGQWGEEVPSAPYMLEPLIDRYAEETSAEVKLALLTASCRLFFKRPPELQNMLGRLLDAALEDPSSSDVRDKALFYFRLLRRDVGAAQRVVSGRDPCGVIAGAFAEDNCALMDRLVDEAFNTLARGRRVENSSRR